jgi:hypothetical protein
MYFSTDDDGDDRKTLSGAAGRAMGLFDAADEMLFSRILSSGGNL